MNRTAELEKLFECWQKSNNELAQGFSPDGIVDESMYDRAKLRILFVLKEPNGHSDDMRCHARHAERTLRESGRHRYATWRNLARWSHGLLFDHPQFSEMEKGFRSSGGLLSIAIINLKKTRGESKTRPRELSAFVANPINKAMLRQEMEIIDPTVIICCGRQSVGELVKEIVAPESKWSPLENGLLCFEWRRSAALSFWHPAARAKTASLYSSLIEGVEQVLPRSDHVC
ncbi:MAG TPA: hypothetical protein VFQ24_00725 [Terriglobia bacterium]|nr:hypothetical protein [Terriglobia bacterium]